MGSVSNIGAVQDLYQSCAHQFGAAFARLAAGYEADPDLRRDLVQEIHVALWLSFVGLTHAVLCESAPSELLTTRQLLTSPVK